MFTMILFVFILFIWLYWDNIVYGETAAGMLRGRVLNCVLPPQC